MPSTQFPPVAVALFVAACLACGVVRADDTSAAAADAPVPPPDGAVILFDGDDLDKWTHPGGDEPRWRLVDGAMEVRGGSLITRDPFTDFTLHVEFWLPRMPENVTGQARSNSGVYLQGLYEIQVLDSYGLDELGTGDCGAIYGQKVPDVNASRPPETWQAYDIAFRAPRFDDEGNQTQAPRVTVVFNGRTIHDDVEITGATRASMARRASAEGGPIMLQDHGNPVRYRNIWIVPEPASE